MQTKLRIFLASLTALFGCAQIRGQVVNNSEYQTIFGIESHPIAKPIDVPAEALKLLGKDSFVSGCLADNDRYEVPREWFVASAVQIRVGKQTDLIVFPRDRSSENNSCLFRAHSIPVWILLKTQSGYFVALTDDVQEVKILRTISHGYRDIRTSITTTLADTAFLYRFDGHRYRLLRKWAKKW